MKILLANAIVAHGAFHHWMTQDLTALGHEVLTFDPDELCEQFGIELYRRTLLQRIAAHRPEILLVYPPYDLLRSEDAGRIRELGTTIVGFAYDDPIFLPLYLRRPGDFEAICDDFRNVYDVYVTTSRAIEREATTRGIPHLRHIRWACNTPPQLDDRPHDIPVLVIGAPYPRRVAMVRHLKLRGIRPVVFGAEGWKGFADVADCYQGMLTRPGMFDMYRRAQIAIAPADWESTYTPMVKLRTLEIMSMGAFQLCETCEDLADYYADGQEIVSYRDWDQLADLIQFYLANPRLRQQIARAGFERTCRDHVWKVRWSEIQQLAEPHLASHAAARSNPADPDHALPHEMSLSACAGHYEKLADLATAKVAIDEWLALSPNCFTALLARGRLQIAEKNFDAAEQSLQRALAAAPGLCTRAIDCTVTQRKLGPRLGLGKLFPGIFPRQIEVYSHLLMLYAQTDQQSQAERLMSHLATLGQDVLFVAIVSLLAESGIEQVIGPKFLARYVEVVISSDPVVWAGERTRHLGQFWMLRGQALCALGQRQSGRDCLQYALTCNPYPNVREQIMVSLERFK